MKLFFFFFFFFFEIGVNSTMGQIFVELAGDLTLIFIHHPYYNSFTKACYKVLPRDWLVVVNNRGYANEDYKGRIETHEYNGRMDVRIWNLERGDAGTYRCEILGTQNFIYQDFQVVINYRDPRPPPAWLSPKSTISPVTSLHTLSGNSLDSPSINKDSWGLRHTLATVFGVATIILIIAIILGVISHKKRQGSDPKHVQSTSSASSETRERSLSCAPDIIPQTHEHLNSIIYTTVNFKPHEETSELYANLCLSNSGAIRPDSGRALKTQESVEYSTIARIL